MKNEEGAKNKGGGAAAAKKYSGPPESYKFTTNSSVGAGSHVIFPFGRMVLN